VTTAVISSAGVTSKAGLKTSASGGVIAVQASLLSSSGRPFLDRDLGPRGQGPVDCGRRRDHDERHTVMARRDGQAVGADLVGDVEPPPLVIPF
jgi:hypothetical protein